MQVRQHGVLQRYPSLLLQRLEGLCVVMLPEVLEAKADGFLFSVLEGHNEEEIDSRFKCAAQKLGKQELKLAFNLKNVVIKCLYLNSILKQNFIPSCHFWTISYYSNFRNISSYFV